MSEQTDVSDLFGSDLPVPDSDDADQSDASEGGSGTGARFAWCDGIFLSALKAGKWVLLDELNLATQVRDLAYATFEGAWILLISSNKFVSGATEVSFVVLMF